MSSKVEDELKAGHPPAVKVGGMRITQHKVKEVTEKCDVKNESQNDDDEEVSLSPPKQQNLVICGSVTRGNADFPPEAIKSYHEKPMASNNFRNTKSKNIIIQQPRK